MESLITSFLLQSAKTTLPYIGTFYHQWTSSKLDVVNKQILPPVRELIFHESSDSDAGNLVNFISRKQHIQLTEAKTELDKYCNYWKDKLNRGDSLNFETIGLLRRNEEGLIYFQSERSNQFLQPVSAERVLHENAAHNVLVGDKETTSTLMNQYYSGEIVLEKSHWGTWAIILLAIAASVLFFHFNTHSFSTSGVGNEKHLAIPESPVTHDVIQNK